MQKKMIQGCCPLDCQDSCAWVAHVEGGRVVRVEGAAGHSITRGMLCAKVHDYHKRLDAPDRLLHPLLRTGGKGTGQFSRITWDEAITRIAERFSRIIGTHGGEALLPVHYLGSLGVVQQHALLRLFHVLGASRQHGSICGQSGNVLAAEGHPLGFDPEEVSDSRLVLLWGANILTTAPHQWQFIKAARERHGARVICIDPRRTLTAHASDEHVSLRPGSDAVLAAGLAHVWVRDGLVNLELARPAVSDLDGFCGQIAPWNPQRVGAVCGIAAETVVRLARALAAAKPAVIRAGIGPQQTVHGEAFVRLLSALAILGGHWQHTGGGLLIETAPMFHGARVGRPDFQTHGTRSFDLARLGETLTTSTLAPPIQGLMVWGTNPAVVQPDAGRVRRGLAREDLFTVVIDHFMTDTAAFADIVLPSTMQLEHFDVQGAWGHHYITVNQPAIEPLGEAKSHGEVLRRLALAMQLQHPALQESDEEMAAAALPPDVPMAQLQADAWVKCSPARPVPGSAKKLLLCGGVPLPPMAQSPKHLQLLTPKGHYFLNSSLANAARQRQSMRHPQLEMHHEDAATRGLADGQQIEIRRDEHVLQAHLAVTDRIHRGVVALPGKWWRTDFGSSGFGINDLVAPAWSPGGQPAYNDVFVEVSAAG